MDGKMFQLVLTLVRNLLAVDDPSSPLVRASVVDSQQALYVKDALIERLFNENVMDLLLALTQHVGGEQPFLRQDNLLILEILNYLLASQMPDTIASAREKVQKVLVFPHLLIEPGELFLLRLPCKFPMACSLESLCNNQQKRGQIRPADENGLYLRLPVVP